MWEITGLLLVALAAFLVYDALRARELAVGVARAACARQGLQFLDDTVSRARTEFARDGDGRTQLRRTYRFEFSGDGVTRRAGSIVVRGSVVESLALEPAAAS